MKLEAYNRAKKVIAIPKYLIQGARLKCHLFPAGNFSLWHLYSTANEFSFRGNAIPISMTRFSCYSYILDHMANLSSVCMTKVDLCI